MTETKIKRLHCNSCGQATNHSILHQELMNWTDRGTEPDEYEYEISGCDTYQMVKCLGFNDVHFTTLSWFSENTNAYGDPKNHEFPSANAKVRMTMRVFDGTPQEDICVPEYKEESYISLQNDTLRLCLLGIRALLEQIMIEKVGDQGKLGKNVDAFFEHGYVAPQSQDIFRRILVEAGSAAMHRRYKPASDDINTLLDIAESLVASIYVHPKHAANVEKTIPQRTSRQLRGQARPRQSP